MLVSYNSGSERSDSGSDSQRSPERGSIRSGPLHPLTALAALKRKRKKFSDSRRTAEGERTVAGVAEALQRASSVPARPPPIAPPRAPRPPPPTVSPSTTTESVQAKGGSREPLLASLDDDAQKVSGV